MSVTIHSESRPMPPASAATFSPSRTSIPTAPAPEEGSFSHVFRSLGREIDRGERAVVRATQSAASGGDLGPNELLALQAGIYRYSEAVDLAAKLVDRLASGVKTVVAGQ